MISTALLLTRSVNAQWIGGDEARCCLAFHSSVLKYSVVFASLGAGAAGQPYALGYGAALSSRFVVISLNCTIPFVVCRKLRRLWSDRCWAISKGSRATRRPGATCKRCGHLWAPTAAQAADEYSSEYRLARRPIANIQIGIRAINGPRNRVNAHEKLFCQWQGSCQMHMSHCIV